MPFAVNHKIFFNWSLNLFVLYSFELQMMGVIFSIAMIAGGVSLWIKRRKIRRELEDANDEFVDDGDAKNFKS